VLNSRPGATKTLSIGTVAFVPGAVSRRAAGNISGTQRKLGQIIPDIVQTQSWHYNTTAVIQRHQKRYVEWIKRDEAIIDSPHFTRKLSKCFIDTWVLQGSFYNFWLHPFHSSMSNLLPVDSVFHGVHSAKMPTADSVAVLKRMLMLGSLLLQSTLNRITC